MTMNAQKHVTKGFTLIELIAIISILGLLALIAVPVVNNVVKESKIKANKIACQNYINAVQQYIVEAQMNGKPIKNGVYDLSYFSDKIEMNYQNEFEGTIVISKSNINDYTIKKENQTFAYQNNEITYVDEKEVKYSQMISQNYVSISASEKEYQYEWESEYRSLIKNVYFRNITIPDDLVYKKYLLSVTGDDPIYAYLVLNKEKYVDDAGNKLDMYDLYITSDNIIKLPNDCAQMFRTYSNVVEINFQNIYTSNVTSYSWFLGRNPKLERVNVEALDLTNATRIDQMFNGDNSLKHLEVTDWNTSKVTNMAWVFNSCLKLDGLDVSKWDVKKVTTISGMFWYVNSFRITGLDKWEITSKLTDMKWFTGGLNTGEDYLDLSGWDVSKVKDMSSAFQGIKVKELNLNGWNPVTSDHFDNMFNGSSVLEKIYSGDWSIKEGATSESMFSKSTKLPNYNSSKIDASMANTQGYFTKK